MAQTNFGDEPPPRGEIDDYINEANSVLSVLRIVLRDQKFIKKADEGYELPDIADNKFPAVLKAAREFRVKMGVGKVRTVEERFLDPASPQKMHDPEKHAEIVRWINLHPLHCERLGDLAHTLNQSDNAVAFKSALNEMFTIFGAPPPFRIPDIKIRGMTESDLGEAFRLSSSIPWAHTLEDWKFMLSRGQGFVASEKNQVVGTAMWWLYGNDNATIGMVIVSEDRQKLGIGRKLVDAVLLKTGDRTVQLNASSAAVKLYKDLGFVSMGAQINKHQGSFDSLALLLAASDEIVRPALNSDFEAIRKLDHKVTGMPRGALLTALMEAGTGAVLERNGVLEGFAVRRAAYGAGFIGPVIACGDDDAKRLITSLVKSPAETVRIDVASDAGEIANWLTAQGLPFGGSGTTQMMRGPDTKQHSKYRLYSVASQALG